MERGWLLRSQCTPPHQLFGSKMHSYLNAGKCCHAIVISDHHITQASEVPNTKLEGPRRGLSFKPVHAVAVLWFEAVAIS